MKRPSYIFDAHIEFMDRLLRMGWCKMFDAQEDIETYFRMTPKEAKGLISYWLSTFESRFTNAPGQTEDN
jgi:hypothetical protein